MQQRHQLPLHLLDFIIRVVPLANLNASFVSMTIATPRKGASAWPLKDPNSRRSRVDEPSPGHAERGTIEKERPHRSGTEVLHYYVVAPVLHCPKLVFALLRRCMRERIMSLRVSISTTSTSRSAGPVLDLRDANGDDDTG